MTGRHHREAQLARRVRARELAADTSVTQIAEQVYAACAPQYGTTRIKAHRLAYGIALADVVEQVRALYEREGKPVPGIGETLLSAYESGIKRPGPEYLHYLCLVYRVEPEALGFDGPCICGRGHGPAAFPAATADLMPTTPEPASEHRDGWIPPLRTSLVVDGSEAEEEDNVLRRTLLQILAGAGLALDGEFLGAIDNIRRRMDGTLTSATVAPTMLDQWEETTAGYGRQYMTTPPLRLLCDTLLDFSDIRRMCAHRQPIELSERLCRIAARLAGLSGIILIDLGDHRLARSFFRTGRNAADETGDRALRSWVTVREAVVPLYYGDPREAVLLARKAADLAGRTPSAAASMAPIIEARALARQGQRGGVGVADRVKRALERGRTVFGQLGADDQADTVFGYTHRQLVFHEGDALARVGDERQAEERLDRALQLYPRTERLDWTLIELSRATCRLRGGEVEEALRIGMDTVLELPAEHRTDIVLQRARELQAAAVARAPDASVVGDFRDALALPGPRLSA